MYSEYFYFGLEKSDQFLSSDAEPTSLSKAVNVAMANINGAIEVRATAPVRPEGYGSGVEFNERFFRAELEGKTEEEIQELIDNRYDQFVKSWKASPPND